MTLAGGLSKLEQFKEVKSGSLSLCHSLFCPIQQSSVCLGVYTATPFYIYIYICIYAHILGEPVAFRLSRRSRDCDLQPRAFDRRGEAEA